MSPPANQVLTEREAQFMQVLWDRGAVTAEQVRLALPRKLHDSTVRTVLRVLERKGQVRHRKRGRTYVYRPVRARSHAERSAVRSLLERFFGGSAEALMLRLIEDEHLTPKQLDELRNRPSKRRGRSRAGGST